jgi:hypothetical protein
MEGADLSVLGKDTDTGRIFRKYLETVTRVAQIDRQKKGYVLHGDRVNRNVPLVGSVCAVRLRAALRGRSGWAPSQRVDGGRETEFLKT